MSLKDFLKSFPIVNQLVEILDDYNVILAGLLLFLAGLVPELGLQNSSEISSALVVLSGLFAAGYTLWDIVDVWQGKKQLPPK